ncbi:Tautomerase/MIF superfamily [Cladochytrium replicatum]|nr:Tautomerase/MIF superfamily [Cladochytrium replicatum]
MPFLDITTNVSAASFKALAEKATDLIVKVTGKPKSFVAVQVQSQPNLVWNGTSEPAAVARFYSLGASNLKENSEFSKQFAELFEAELGVGSTRSYIFFNAFEPSDIGYGGKTLAG